MPASNKHHYEVINKIRHPVFELRSRSENQRKGRVTKQIGCLKWSHTQKAGVSGTLVFVPFFWTDLFFFFFHISILVLNGLLKMS